MKPAIKLFVAEYLAEMLEGNVAIFAGAGLSVPAGYVDWRALIKPLSQELQLNIDLETDLIALAQFHVNANGTNRHKIHTQVIEALSSDRPPTENHKILAQLPISTWWTTNYDKLIETALKDAGRIVDVKIAVPQLATTRPRRDATVYKMHGDVDRPDQAVVTRDDYEKYANERGAFITTLSGDLVSKTFLFLGFSFTDPNLEHVLSTIRLNFRENQRRHYAVFRTRSKLAHESDGDYDHHKMRQVYVIEDLKRYNIRVLLVDDFREITEFLTELLKKLKRRTIFIAASAADFNPWGESAVSALAQELGQQLVAGSTRIATGLGAGIGDSIFTGALREIHKLKIGIEDNLILRPFPQTEIETERDKVWDIYRRELISHAGIALFLFGNKIVDGETVIADGMIKEFEIAVEQGLVVAPIGATGSAAKSLADRVASAHDIAHGLTDDDRKLVAALSEPRENLTELIDPIINLVRQLQLGDLK